MKEYTEFSFVLVLVSIFPLNGLYTASSQVQVPIVVSCEN